MTTITLDYTVNPGLMGLGAVGVAKVQNALMDQPGELGFLGMTISSDVASVVGSNIRRRVVLATNAQGDEQFPTAASLIAATSNLWVSTLSKSIPAVVSAATPVIT
jgi:hypothetical protein